MKKKFLSLFIVLIFTGCQSIEIWTNYYSFTMTEKEKQIEKIISFHGGVENLDEETSYLNEITLIEKKKNKENFLKILDDVIIIETSSKRYNIKNLSKKDTIEINIQETKINEDDFTVNIGRVQLDSGEILNLPPIKFKRYIYVYKINNILDALNQDTREDLFSGTIEEYREWKKKNK